jgi:hypothetical protein
MRNRLILGAALFATWVGLGLASETDPTSNLPNPASSNPSFDHRMPQIDAEMTQAMGVVGGEGAMQTGAVTDDQLAHARDSAMVLALEQHQRDIDRMLARPAP